MPISAKQLAANRTNAAKSTGPRSVEGKARSAQNARKHGFAAIAYTLGNLEDNHEIEHLVADAVEFYQPQNSQERYAVERIALAQQAVLRAARLEAGMLSASFVDFVHNGDEGLYVVDFDISANPITPEQDRTLMLAQAFIQYGGGGFSLFLRYQAQAERRYRAAIQEFERLKDLRVETSAEPAGDAPAETEMGSFGESLSEAVPAGSEPSDPPQLVAAVPVRREPRQPFVPHDFDAVLLGTREHTKKPDTRTADARPLFSLLSS